MRTMRRRRSIIGLALASALLMTGCSAGMASHSPAGPGGPATSPSTSPSGRDGDFDAVYECNGRPVDPKTFHAGLHADQLPEADAEGIAAAADDGGFGGFIGDPAAWIIAVHSEASITLLRPEDVDGDYEVVVFDRMDQVPSTGEPGWMLTSSASCTLSLDPAPLTPADVSLDPDAMPDAESTRLALLVTERDCNGGQDAEGRVELVSLEETAEAVIVRVAIRPHTDGAFTCQSNPPTPFTVDLSEPIGEREVLNGTFVTPKPITVPTSSVL